MKLKFATTCVATHLSVTLKPYRREKILTYAQIRYRKTL